MDTDNKYYRERGAVWGWTPHPAVERVTREEHIHTALDLGCGNGRDTFFLLTKNIRVTAIDHSQEALRLLHDKAKDSKALITQCADLSTYSITGMYDLIICFNVLHFLERHAALQLLARIKQHTNLGGINIIQAPTDQIPWPGAKWQLSTQQLKAIYDDWTIQHYTEQEGRALAGFPCTTARITAKRHK